MFALLSLICFIIVFYCNIAGAFVVDPRSTGRTTSSLLLSPQRSLCKYGRGALLSSSSWDGRSRDFSLKCEKEDKREDNSSTTTTTRRQVFADAASALVTTTTASFCSLGCCPSPAYGLAQITKPLVSKYDLERNPLQDAAFAAGMASGMKDYEKEAYPKKKELFKKLFASIQEKKNNDEDNDEQPVVVEIGIGSFPNALYYQKNIAEGGLDIIGIDPNDRMEGYARDNAKTLTRKYKDNLRIVHGVSESLPLKTNSVDAVVCTLTLCSVLDPAKSLNEIKRVLKPGGKFLFWEHVLSQTDPDLARQQIELTPQQVKRADGCHLNRRTGQTIQATNFKKLDMEYLELQNFGFLNPTVCGIATA